MGVKLKPKKCRSCKREFFRFNTLEAFCSPACKREGMNVREAEKAARPEKIQLKARGQGKTLSILIQEAQEVINTYAKLRDRGKPCISCGAYFDPDIIWEAGHFRSVGSAPHLRFNLHNIHKQCRHCNQVLSGNRHEYEKNLIIDMGQEKVNRLLCDNQTRNFTVEYCERLKRIFREKTRRRLKRMQLTPDRGRASWYRG